MRQFSLFSSAMFAHTTRGPSREKKKKKTKKKKKRRTSHISLSFLHHLIFHCIQRPPHLLARES
jgi:hypothetical protein